MKYRQPFDQPDSPDASYKNADPALGQRGSILDIVAVEQVQREVVKVITEAGLTPDDTDLTQLWQAIQSLAGTITNTAITNYLTGGSVDVNVPYAVAGGTSDVITAAFSPVLGSLNDGQIAILKIGATSNTTTTPTLNANSLGAKVISRNDGSALAVGDLVANGFAILIYDTATTSWKFVAGLAIAGGGGSGGGSFVPGCYYLWPTETPPVGTLQCNGAAVSRATYSRLFSIIGTMYGPGDGSTTFNLPYWNGETIRIWDNGRGLDPDRATRTNRGDGTTGDHVGTKQGGAAGPISIASGTIQIDSLLFAQSSSPSTFNIRLAKILGSSFNSDANPIDVIGPTTSIPSLYETSLQGTMIISGNSGAAETRAHNMTAMMVIAY